MALNLTTGLEGIRQSNYRVYICTHMLPEISFDASSFREFISHSKQNRKIEQDSQIISTLDSIIEQLIPIGEFRKDSIEITGEEGESIEGNESGEIPLSKECVFTAELINTTAENVNLLQKISQIGGVFLLEEIDGNKYTPKDNSYDFYDFVDVRRYILIANASGIEAKDMLVKFSVSEQDTGGDVPRATIRASMTTGSVSNFRTIKDWALDCSILGDAQDFLGNIGVLAEIGDDSIDVSIPLNNSVLFKEPENEDIAEFVEYDLSQLHNLPDIFSTSITYNENNKTAYIKITFKNSIKFNYNGLAIKVRFKPELSTIGRYSPWFSVPITT